MQIICYYLIIFLLTMANHSWDTFFLLFVSFDSELIFSHACLVVLSESTGLVLWKLSVWIFMLMLGVFLVPCQSQNSILRILALHPVLIPPLSSAGLELCDSLLLWTVKLWAPDICFWLRELLGHWSVNDLFYLRTLKFFFSYLSRASKN